jgi:hypothetical protein
LGLAVLAVFGGFGGIILGPKTFRCDRPAGGVASCTVRTSGLLGYETVFPPRSIASVDVMQGRGGKANSATYFTVMILNLHGAEVHLETYSDREAAERERDQIRTYLDDSTAGSFVREYDPPLPIYIFIILAIAVGCGIVVSAFVRSRNEEVHTPLGVPHVDTTGDGGFASKVLAWKIPLLAFLGIFLASLTFAAIEGHYANETQGILEVQAEWRCKFGGDEILPGGYYRTSIDPGSYDFEVFNPTAPGQWEKQHFVIRIGETTTVHCRPQGARTQ